MNIIEAFKSGKRFRRKNFHTAWFSTSCMMPWGPSDILADDWEVEETSATITSSQFDLAWDRASYGASVEVSQYDEELYPVNRLYINALYSQLKKELGL